MATVAVHGDAVGAPALLLIGNAQASGVGHRTGTFEGVAHGLRSYGGRVEAHLTDTLEELESFVAAADGRRVVVVGGDGSLHALANLTAPPAEVALIPAGGANNIASSLGIPLDRSAAARLALEGRVRSIDGIDAAGPDGRRLALEGVSVGFLARARLRYRSESSADLWEGVRVGLAELRAFEPVEVDVVADGDARRLTVTQLVVANMPRYAFGLRVAPGADPSDGLLDLVAAAPRAGLGVLRALTQLRRGRTELVGRAARVTLHSDDSPVVADSTSLGTGLVSLTVRRDAIRVVAP